MTYQETLDYLFNALPMYQNQGKSAYKANLDNTNALMEILNHPHKQFNSVHIAGTNGKGSVSHALAAIFQQCGYKTGLYTSPHLLDFRERIRINGEMIGEKNVISFTENNLKAFEKIKPSFFEMTVELAFDYFAKQNVDIAIIETGMGGRLDSTNVIQPEASVITNISLDHAQFLGNTLKKIAGEKAGIIKENTPCIIGDMSSELIPVFKTKTQEKNAPIYLSSEKYKTLKQELSPLFNIISYKNKDEQLQIQTDLKGHYQANNIATVLCTIDALNSNAKFTLPKQKVIEALKHISSSTGLRGRWETLQYKPLWIADTGHNEAGIAYIMEQIKQLPHPNKYIIYGCVNDKETGHIFPLFLPDCHYIFTQSQNKRSKEVKQLYNFGKEFNLNCDFRQTVADAILLAQQSATVEDAIIICGSTFVVADALAFFNSRTNSKQNE